MKDILRIEIKNPKAKEVLHLLQAWQWIKLVGDGGEEAVDQPKKSLRGILSKEEGESLLKHIQTLRNEWGG